MSSTGSDRDAGGGPARGRAARPFAPVRLLALPVLAMLAGCSLHMDLPPEFLALERAPAGEIKATTADQARLWVRDFDDPDEGTLAFWTETLRHELIDERGYQLVREHDVQDGDGRAGKAMEFHTIARGEPHGYLIALFVVEGWFSQAIRTVELVAPRAVYDARAPAVLRALATLR